MPVVSLTIHPAEKRRSLEQRPNILVPLDIQFIIGILTSFSLVYVFHKIIQGGRGIDLRGKFWRCTDYAGAVIWCESIACEKY